MAARVTIRLVGARLAEASVLLGVLADEFGAAPRAMSLADALQDPDPVDLLIVDADEVRPVRSEQLKALAEGAGGARVVLVGHGQPRLIQVMAALQAGAHGWFPESYPPDLMAAAFRLVLAGGLHMPHEYPFAM